MRTGVALLVLGVVTSAPAWAFDTSKLPQTCRDTIAEIQSEKPRFGQLGSIMTRARKGKDNADFCAAAKETLTIIVNQSDKIDGCLGDVASDRSLPENVVGEMTQLKAYYRTMLEAAKKPENDRMKCGLADL